MVIRISTFQLSLPAWGAWIEISDMSVNASTNRRSPHGERGLKLAD